MKRYVKSSTGYKSGDRYYGSLPSEPSLEEYGRIMENAYNEFKNFLAENHVTVKTIKSDGPGAEYQLYTWTTPEPYNCNIELVYYERFVSGGDQICELSIDGEKVDVYNSKYQGRPLYRTPYLKEVISALNSVSDDLKLVFK